MHDSMSKENTSILKLITLPDTRTEGKYRRGHIEDFRNIPVDERCEQTGEFETCKPG